MEEPFITAVIMFPIITQTTTASFSLSISLHTSGVSNISIGDIVSSNNRNALGNYAGREVISKPEKDS